MSKMNVHQARQFVRKLFNHNLKVRPKYRKVPMLWGPPGVGKSSIIHDICQEINYNLVDIRLNTLSNLDVRGVPYIDQAPIWGNLAAVLAGKMDVDAFRQQTDEQMARAFDFIPPPFLPIEGSQDCLLFEEVNTAPPSNQAVGYQVALDRALGSHPLPDNTLIVFAGNRAEDRGATYEMPDPLKNRLVHITILPDHEAFVKYGLQVGLDESVLAFVSYQPDKLFVRPDTNDDPAFPSPRTWEFLSSFMGENPDVIEMSAFIGEATAVEFAAFRQLREHLPNLDDILEDGETFDHAEMSVRYSYLVGLSTHYIKRITGLKNPFAEPEKTNKWTGNYINAICELPEELITLGVHLIQGTEALAAVASSPDYDRIQDRVSHILA